MTYVTKIYMPDREKFKAYIDGIYESGWLTNNGPLVHKLEKKLEEFFMLKICFAYQAGQMLCSLLTDFWKWKEKL